jgi:hypothetical protein
VAKKLACRLGRHEWTTRVEGGENYKVCAACGKSPKGSRRSGAESERKGFDDVLEDGRNADQPVASCTRGGDELSG